MEARIVTLDELNDLLTQGATIHHVAPASTPTSPHPRQWLVIVTIQE